METTFDEFPDVPRFERIVIDEKTSIDVPITGPLTADGDDLVELLLSPDRGDGRREVLEIILLRDGRKLSP